MIVVSEKKKNACKDIPSMTQSHWKEHLSEF